MASLAAQVPHYSHDQQIVGAAVFVAILLVAAIASVVRTGGVADAGRCFSGLRVGRL
jgi:hypothetical protein